LYTPHEQPDRTQRVIPSKSQAQAKVQKFNRAMIVLMALAFLFGTFFSFQAAARGAPDSFADLAERLSPAVVNISTTQIVKNERGGGNFPQFPPGHPFEDFFKDFGGKDIQCHLAVLVSALCCFTQITNISAFSADPQ